MPPPFTTSQYEHRDNSIKCPCNECALERLKARDPYRYGYEDKPGLNWPISHWLRLLIASITIVLVLLGLSYAAQQAFAREGQVQPVKAPASLLRAREACPDASTLTQCRGKLRAAYASVEWQRKARWHAQAQHLDEMTRDAIHWAAEKYGRGTAGKRALELQMLGIGHCESHLFPWATNGQYMSWAQLSERHRSDPVIARLTWRDPYAVADHVARYVLAHGFGEWQCRPEGGLRW